MDQARLAEIANADWYYNIELKGGIQTNGRKRFTSDLYREHLRRTNIKGAHCLDIGTQEFMAPVILKRQGAASVTAYDRLALVERCEAVKYSYDVEFDYLHSISMQELKPALKAAGKRTVFDIVNFSGVLYHMVDPLPGLAMARSFLREGGVMILETSVKRSNDHILAFNASGKMYEGSNYFQVSVATLEYWCRMLRMAPIDCSWTGGEDIFRLVMVCRAVNRVVAEAGDDWMRKGFISSDFAPFGLSYKELESSEPAVDYKPLDTTIRVPRKNVFGGLNAIDVYASVEATPRFRSPPDGGALRLSDRS